MYTSHLSEKQRQSFNFHCTICFEAFHPETRPPVILPCGHTFLCAPCSKRITRCMECRTSLFYTPSSDPICDKTPTPDILTWSNRQRGPYYSRSSPRPQSPKVVLKKPLPAPIPYPLPKNLLLLSLMETAQMEATAKRAVKRIVSRSSRRHSSRTQDPFPPPPPPNHRRRRNHSLEFRQLQTVASNASEGSTEVLLTGTILHDPSEIPMEFSYDPPPSSDLPYQLSSSDDDDDDDEPLMETDEDFDDDDDRLITAMGAMTSTCGTYAVVERHGLLVLPRKPKDVTEGDYQIDLSNSNSNANSNANANAAPQTPPEKIKRQSPIRRMSLKRVLKRRSSEDSASLASTGAKSATKEQKEVPPPPSPTLLERTYSNPPLPYELEYGAKIQVVCIHDGWVTLARNQGFLYVDHSQLVKVGGPKDRACEIEGMLVSLHHTRNEMAQRKELLQTVETNLVDKLHKSLQTPSPTIVLPTANPALHEPSSPPGQDHQDHQKRIDALHLASPKPAKPQPPPSTQLPDLNGLTIDTHDDSHSVDHLTLPHLSPSPTSQSSPLTPHQSPLRPLSTPYRSPHRSQPPPSSSPAHRRRSMPSPVSPASQRVDFRTGMSGHHALSSHHRKLHRTTGTAGGRTVGRMADHRGLAGVTWNLLRRLGSSDGNEGSTGSQSQQGRIFGKNSHTGSIPEGDS